MNNSATFEKSQMLMDAALKAVPGATATDFERPSPFGEKLLTAIDNGARQLFRETNDQDWLRAGKALRARAVKTKPVRDFDIK